MKTCCALRAAMVFGLSLAAAEAQASVLAFTASSAGIFTALGVPPSDVSVHIEHALVVGGPAGGGLPLSTLVADETVIFSTLPPSVIDGTFTFTDVGGNTLGGTFTGDLLDTANPAVKQVIGPFSFAGGSGPYTGATGSGQLDAQIQFLDPTGAFGVSVITWEGQLELIPEPRDVGLIVGLGLLGFAVCRRQRSR